MQKFFHKKVLTPFLSVVLAAVCIAGGAFLGSFGGAERIRARKFPGVRPGVQNCILPGMNLVWSRSMRRQWPTR